MRFLHISSFGLDNWTTFPITTILAYQITREIPPHFQLCLFSWLENQDEFHMQGTDTQITVYILETQRAKSTASSALCLLTRIIQFKRHHFPQTKWKGLFHNQLSHPPALYSCKMCTLTTDFQNRLRNTSPLVQH